MLGSFLLTVLSGEAAAGTPSVCEYDENLDSLLEAMAVVLGFGLCAFVHRLRTTLQKPSEQSCEFDGLASDRARRHQNEITDALGCTALHLAANAGASLEVRRLLEAGFDPNAREAWGETPLHMVARAGHLEVARLLVSQGALIDAANADDKTPLALATEVGHRELCGYLRGAGADVRQNPTPTWFPMLLGHRSIERSAFPQKGSVLKCGRC
eukprot:TRINITY_DN13623_c0_g2_i1.p1 TRINITY_DN13623_c0_g2~~TRINITY_DN13623_c0_g2_i1.p1  ORF type:complete len:212 (+),score=39.98 TRINITY_DN13623_c0_g2_i1:149-784(+)